MIEDRGTASKLTRCLMQAPALAKWITRSLYTEGIETDEQIRTLLRDGTDSVYYYSLIARADAAAC